MSDHSEGFRQAFQEAFVGSPFGQCWPHIIRKFVEGEYVQAGASSKWIHFEDAQEDMRAIHLAGSTGMKELLIRECGKVWDKWGQQMRPFWNSYCVDPWDCWSIGDFGCMLCTPSQQAQESWHKFLMRSRIPGTFRASTEYVFAEALPQLVELDGVLSPKVLGFDVPAIPKQMMEKALWYVQHQTTHIQVVKSEDGSFAYYFLAKDNRGKYPKLTTRLIDMYEAALNGNKDPRIKSHETLLDVCLSLHKVVEADEAYGVPECEGNPCDLDCPGCKGFKHSGICSHVLAVNHILEKFNVKYQLAEIGKKTDKGTKGKSKAPPKALTRIPQQAASKGKGKAKGKAKAPPPKAQAIKGKGKESSDESDSSEED